MDDTHMMATTYLYLRNRGYEGNIRMKPNNGIMGCALFYSKDEFELDGGVGAKIESKVFEGLNSEGNPMS
jgi:hypothetical protein